MLIVVPTAFPAKLDCDGLTALTFIVKSDEPRVPPLSLVTVLITVRDAPRSLFSMLQVTFSFGERVILLGEVNCPPPTQDHTPVVGS